MSSGLSIVSIGFFVVETFGEETGGSAEVSVCVLPESTFTFLLFFDEAQDERANKATNVISLKYRISPKLALIFIIK